MRAVGLAMVMTMTGVSNLSCLVTDDIVERVEPPPTPEAPHPPSIVESSVSPTNWSCRKVADVECQPDVKIEFKVQTIVDKGTDSDTHRLAAKWFLDYDPDPGTPKRTEAGGFISDQPDESGVRLCGDACLFSFEPFKHGGGVHVLKIMISDGFDNVPNQPDKVLPGRGSASYAWCVDTSNCVGGGR